MGLGPVPATKRVLEQAGLTIDDVGLFELNEPFAVQVLTWCDGVGVAPDDPRLNPYGGAIACGHPLAATGVRLMAQLAHGFRERPGRPLRPDGALHRARHGRGDPLGEPCRRRLDGAGQGSGGGGFAGAVAEERWLTRRSSSSSGRHARGPDRARDDGQRRGLAEAEHVRRGGAPLARGACSTGCGRATGAGSLLTGKPFVFAVGADIDEFGEITPERARDGGEAGHELFGRIRELPFPTLAAINGAALGGGVEIALHCDYRTISSSVRHFACPEVFLGLIPGWGGTQLSRGSSAPSRR